MNSNDMHRAENSFVAENFEELVEHALSSEPSSYDKLTSRVSRLPEPNFVQFLLNARSWRPDSRAALIPGPSCHGAAATGGPGGG